MRAKPSHVDFQMFPGKNAWVASQTVFGRQWISRKVKGWRLEFY
jgi:hypothetical protein